MSRDRKTRKSYSKRSTTRSSASPATDNANTTSNISGNGTGGGGRSRARSKHEEGNETMIPSHALESASKSYPAASTGTSTRTSRTTSASPANRPKLGIITFSNGIGTFDEEDDLAVGEHYNNFNNNNDHHDQDDESELFPSLDYESCLDVDENNPRPPSQNSIASVLKNSLREAKEMIHKCGVGVGVGASTSVNNDGTLSSDHMPQKFHGSDAFTSYADTIPGRTRTTSSNSLPLSLHSDNNDEIYSFQRQQYQHQHQLQSHQSNHNQIPFPLSIYPSSSTTGANTNPQGYNNDTIPLRYSQSVPHRPEPLPIAQPFMRRSASTPATFNPGKGRSAFGKVEGVNKSFRKRTTYSSFTSPTSQSLSTTKSIITSPQSDGKYNRRRSNGDILTRHMSSTSNLKNTIRSITSDNKKTTKKETDKTAKETKPTSAKEDKSQAEVQPSKNEENTIDAYPLKESLSTTSTEESSSVLSTSGMMSLKLQRMIKKRIKGRRQLDSKKVLDENTENLEEKSVGQEAEVKAEAEAEAEIEGNEVNESIISSDSNSKISNDTITVATVINDNNNSSNKKSLDPKFATLDEKSQAQEKRSNEPYLSLEPKITPPSGNTEEGNYTIDESCSVDFTPAFTEKKRTTILRKVESPTPIPQPAYHKIVDDDQPSPSYSHAKLPLPFSQSRRISRTPPSPIGRVATPPSNPSRKRLILKGSTSPCSHDSASNSRTSRSIHSVNTSTQTFSTNVSCNRSVTSSVAEADREVRDTNRRELRRREGADYLDGSMSIQSSDTTSTNAYLALTSSPAQLREGANIHHDRFFGGCTSSNSIGPGNSQSSNASSFGQGWNHQSQQHYSPGMNSRSYAHRNVRSPMTVSSNSITNYTHSSASTGEDPPRFVSCSLNKVVPVNSNRGDMPPRSDNHDSSLGYKKLGAPKSRSKSRSSSRSSSSKSKSSKSKSSKSKKKEKQKLYHKIGSSAKVADQFRSSTPSPCNSFHTSPVKTPITPPNQFDYPSELVNVAKPRVQKLASIAPGPKLVLVSPVESDRRRDTTTSRPIAQSFWPSSGRDQRAFQPTVILESVVTPEKSFSRENSETVVNSR